MNARSPRRVRLLGALAAALVITGCGPDGPDVFTAPPTVATGDAAGDPPPRTIPPTTTVAPEAPPPSTFPPNGETVQVRSLDNSFRPETVEIVAGTEVWWTNNGRNDHNVLPVDETMTWGVDTDGFVPGDEYRFVFDTPGVFPYYCSIHGTKEVGMVGTVIVAAPAG